MKKVRMYVMQSKTVLNSGQTLTFFFLLIKKLPVFQVESFAPWKLKSELKGSLRQTEQMPLWQFLQLKNVISICLDSYLKNAPRDFHPPPRKKGKKRSKR